jgi:hypothetical protein
MFETLEDMAEKSKPPLDRGWPALTYSLYAIVGLVYLILGAQRHQLLGPVVGAVTFLLSLVWLITTIRSPVLVNRRDFRVRAQILVWILLAYEIAYTVCVSLK